MRFWKAWIIAQKDLRTLWRKKNILRSTIILPLFISVGLPIIIDYSLSRHGKDVGPAEITGLLNAFGYFFVIFAAVLPTAIASYTIVGEKVEKSLEPLLATPTTDGEILLGKSFASFLPPLLAIYGGAGLFMALMDNFTYPILHYLFFPNWGFALILLVVVPLAAVFSVQLNVVISSRVSDVRAVQQFGGLAVLPFAGIYVGTEIGLINLDTQNLLIIAAVVLAADVVLFFLATATFKREEILTRWK